MTQIIAWVGRRAMTSRQRRFAVALPGRFIGRRSNARDRAVKPPALLERASLSSPVNGGRSLRARRRRPDQGAAGCRVVPESSLTAGLQQDVLLTRSGAGAAPARGGCTAGGHDWFTGNAWVAGSKLAGLPRRAGTGRPGAGWPRRRHAPATEAMNGCRRHAGRAGQRRPRVPLVADDVLSGCGKRTAEAGRGSSLTMRASARRGCAGRGRGLLRRHLPGRQAVGAGWCGPVPGGSEAPAGGPARCGGLGRMTRRSGWPSGSASTPWW